jgi:hypothetical protein
MVPCHQEEFFHLYSLYDRVLTVAPLFEVRLATASVMYMSTFLTNTQHVLLFNQSLTVRVDCFMKLKPQLHIHTTHCTFIQT